MYKIIKKILLIFTNNPGNRTINESGTPSQPIAPDNTDLNHRDANHRCQSRFLP